MNDFYLYRHAWISAPHYNEQLSDEQCDALLKKGGWMVRNTYDFDQKEESNFWYIIKDSFGGMDELSTNVRTKVRRAFKRFAYQKVDKQIIEKNGYEVVDKAFKSYPIKDRRMNKNVFKGYLESWDVENHDFWGAFDRNSNKLVGFVVVRLYDNSCFYDLVTFNPKYKHNTSYPFCGFFYKLNEYYLGEKHFDYVTDGSRSMTQHSNIQPFLIQKFKFRKAYCKLNIKYQWWFGILVRMLYPFRNIIRNRSMKAVLLMHEIWKKQ